MVTGGWFMTLFYPHEFKVRLRKVTVNPPPMSSNMSGRNRKSHSEKWRFLARKIHQPKKTCRFSIATWERVNTCRYHSLGLHIYTQLWCSPGCRGLTHFYGWVPMAWLLKMLNPRKITWIHVSNELPFNYPYLVAHSTAYKWVSSPQFFEGWTRSKNPMKMS